MGGRFPLEYYKTIRKKKGNKESDRLFEWSLRYPAA